MRSIRLEKDLETNEMFWNVYDSNANLYGKEQLIARFEQAQDDILAEMGEPTGLECAQAMIKSN